jgi:hypothetical protein
MVRKHVHAIVLTGLHKLSRPNSESSALAKTGFSRNSRAGQGAPWGERLTVAGT